jgi:fructokinase
MSRADGGEACFGGIEAGGTKFVCGVGSGPADLRLAEGIPTRDPKTTMDEVAGFFQSVLDSGASIRGLGIGSFGPLELDPRASDYGSITTTPKPGWQGVNLLDDLASRLRVPVAIDTDVNAAALGEWVWGAARGLDHFLYVTVGTGLGVGAVVDGRILHGLHHPEMGHMLIPVSAEEPGGFSGVCPYHGSCAEGLASGSAIVARWGRELSGLGKDHPAWRLEADYLAALFTNLTLTLQPQRIVVGGGVMNEDLLSLVREALHVRLAGYRASLAEREALSGFLVTPGLGRRAGVLGAIELAARAAESMEEGRP